MQKEGKLGLTCRVKHFCMRSKKIHLPAHFGSDFRALASRSCVRIHPDNLFYSATQLLHLLLSAAILSPNCFLIFSKSIQLFPSTPRAHYSCLSLVLKPLGKISITFWEARGFFAKNWLILGSSARRVRRRMEEFDLYFCFFFWQIFVTNEIENDATRAKSSFYTGPSMTLSCSGGGETKRSSE